MKKIRGIIYILLCLILIGCSNAQTDKKEKSSEVPKKATTTVEDSNQNNQSQNAEKDKQNENNSIDGNKTINTNTVKKKKVIVIDPGHASRASSEVEPIAPGSSKTKLKESGGAAGVVTRTPEYLINMNVALKLRDLLVKKNFTVIMTKTDNSVMLGNIERAQIANRNNADLEIRIHADSSDNRSISGASMQLPANLGPTKPIYEESKKYGETVLNSLVTDVGMKNRGVSFRSDLTGFNWSKVSVILVEMGFLSNPQEDKMLSNNDYEEKLAVGLADGIDSALN